MLRCFIIQCMSYGHVIKLLNIYVFLLELLILQCDNGLHYS